ncbi:hypothetical protein AAG570_012205 [Ranatra chinensis]|uniref:Transcriptional adapter 3 n=1 Tax=Ranatra chinensis TaxID=642074 RepID=A0ABD0Z6G7_9HEMI
MKSKHSKKESKSKEITFGNSGKMKEARSRSPETPEDCDFTFPILKTVDKARNLHCYSAVLGRGKEDGVSMEDLDRLQPELESLLSAVAVRLRTLQAEVTALSTSEDKSEKKNATVPSNLQKKRKLNEVRVSKSMKDLSKVRDREGSTKVEVGSSGNETDNSADIPYNSLKPESSKVVIPKNDTPNKFWASVEPYCSEVTPENIKELEDLIASCDNDCTTLKIPPLGKHYTARWADEDLMEEKESSNLERTKRNKTYSGRDKTPGPLVQRLVSALMEENVIGREVSPIFTDEADGSYLAKLPLYHTTACFERRIRRELEAIGFLEANNDDTDEILSEIKKCDEELKLVASQNKEHLKRLLGLAKQEIARQDIRNKIKLIDAEILEIYRKTTASKLKKKQLQKKEKEQAWKALKDREALLKSLDSM